MNLDNFAYNSLLLVFSLFRTSLLIFAKIKYLGFSIFLSLLNCYVNYNLNHKLLKARSQKPATISYEL